MNRRARGVLWDALTVLVTAAFLLPVLWVLVASLRPPRDIVSGPLLPTHFTLVNYAHLFAQPDFVVALRNSLIVGLLTALGALLLALPTAYALARLRFKGRELVGVLVMLTQLIPGIVVVIPLVVLLRSVHLTNSVLGLALVHVLIGLPIAVWLLRGYIEDIPYALEEAALVDGASRRQVLRHVLLPLLLPATAAVGTFAFVLSWGEYLLALSLLTSPDSKTLPLALQSLFDPYQLDWGLVMAGGTLIALPVALLFLLIRGALVEGLASGGVKG